MQRKDAVEKIARRRDPIGETETRWEQECSREENSVMKLLVSACLMGENCKYNGGNNKKEAVCSFAEKAEVRCICPEVLGGLPTPRVPAEIRGEQVVNRAGEDVTRQFLLGAERSLAIAEAFAPDLVILQPRSPSCGVHSRYDGSFTGTLVPGPGMTAALLLKNGFPVIDSEDLEAGRTGV